MSRIGVGFGNIISSFLCQLDSLGRVMKCACYFSLQRKTLAAEIRFGGGNAPGIPGSKVESSAFVM